LSSSFDAWKADDNFASARLPHSGERCSPTCFGIPDPRKARRPSPGELAHLMAGPTVGRRAATSWPKIRTYGERTERRDPTKQRGAALRFVPPSVQVSIHCISHPSPRSKNAGFPNEFLRNPAKKAADCAETATECTRNIHFFCRRR
jgi:hypothetical protein